MKKQQKKDGADKTPKKRGSTFGKSLARRKSIKADMEEEMDPTKVLLKPDDQLELTPEELKVEHTRILSARNPHAPDNLVTFDFTKYIFQPGPNIQHMETNFKRSGTLIHVDTDEAIAQLKPEEETVESDETTPSSTSVVESSSQAAATNSQASVASQAQAAEEKPKKKEKLIKNQFNYQDRGTQSAVQPPRPKSIQTDPPARIEMDNQVSQDVIYDFYERHLAELKAEKDKAATKQKGSDKEKIVKRADKSEEKGAFTAKVVERMLNQNTYDQLADDFKYFDDPSDGPENQKGSLLPLWRFEYEKAKRLAITSMVWSPQQRDNDLMVVSCGSYDYGKPVKGYLLYYSLKNPSYPEAIYQSETGIMCLDVHPQKSYLTACGLYDGSVVIYNINENRETYLFRSPPHSSHTEPVWSVKWLENDTEDKLRFCSISPDGKVILWTLNKNDLVPSTLLTLTQNDKQLSGICFAFHPNDPSLYLCGTEEGTLFKCSTKYQSQYLDEFKAHDGAIMSVKWNPFHPDVYATAGQDWTLKIWSNKIATPLFNFELGASVNDLDWAPYSSTVVCAVTEGDNSKAYVYDLALNKHLPLCEQSVSQKKRTRLTKITMNPLHKVLIVGNDRGIVSCFKLSPNLRKVPVKSKKDPTPLPLDPQKEFEKLKKVLNYLIDE